MKIISNCICLYMFIIPEICEMAAFGCPPDITTFSVDNFTVRKAYLVGAADGDQ